MSATAAPGASGATPAARALRNADLARAYYLQHSRDPNAVEARKLEAVYLVDAVEGGDEASQARMLEVVQAFRTDTAVSASQRAIVAGTYEFSAARRRLARSQTDVTREFEAVARRLIKEFPHEPQGYVSLLTAAGQRGTDLARSMAMEVIASDSAPPAAVTAARRLVSRLDLPGRPVASIFGDLPLGAVPQAGWPEKQPGLVYFWATWSPESLALGEMLAARHPGGMVNLVGVCLDADAAAAAEVAAARKLPGQLVYIENGREGDLAVQLGADTAPLVYIVDADGRFADVRGLDDLPGKLAKLGLRSP